MRPISGLVAFKNMSQKCLKFVVACPVSGLLHIVVCPISGLSKGFISPVSGQPNKVFD